MARRSHVSEPVTRLLWSPANRRHHPNRPNNHSTTLVRDNTANPCCPSGISTISRPETSPILLPQPPKPTSPRLGACLATPASGVRSFEEGAKVADQLHVGLAPGDIGREIDAPDQSLGQGRSLVALAGVVRHNCQVLDLPAVDVRMVRAAIGNGDRRRGGPGLEFAQPVHHPHALDLLSIRDDSGHRCHLPFHRHRFVAIRCAGHTSLTSEPVGFQRLRCT